MHRCSTPVRGFRRGQGHRSDRARWRDRRDHRRQRRGQDHAVQHRVRLSQADRRPHHVPWRRRDGTAAASSGPPRHRAFLPGAAAFRQQHRAREHDDRALASRGAALVDVAALLRAGSERPGPGYPGRLRDRRACGCGRRQHSPGREEAAGHRDGDLGRSRSRAARRADQRRQRRREDRADLPPDRTVPWSRFTKDGSSRTATRRIFSPTRTSFVSSRALPAAAPQA
jgi:hypothetical protein